MSFDEAYEYLLSLGHETLTIKLGLRNTERLLAALHNPHTAYPSVQIAGTNGKGSTAVMLESICRTAGIRVGLFTSPHLISITERIRIDGKDISEDEFARLTERVKQVAEALVRQGELQTLPTFFEHVTAIALLAFQEANIELAILETGLGGRLDSTTAAGAKIVAITPVSMDHEEYLGHTLAEIAMEKAAIIRPGVAAIIAPQAPQALAVIEQQCQTAGVAPRLLDDSLSLLISRNSDPKLGLRGRHQVVNATTAAAMAQSLRALGFIIPDEAIAKGLETAKHRGRLELWDGRPPILFDGAHNPAAARALRDYLDEFADQPITMIFGAMRDKALHEMAAILFPVAARIVLTPLDNPRAATVEAMESAAPSDVDRSKLSRATSVADAMRIARGMTPPTGLIVVTGSLYLVGAVQESHVAVHQPAN
jgi:dihydrofolate synthase/folylpolyglutamate synthase